jgi:hypothetical protein
MPQTALSALKDFEAWTLGQRGEQFKCPGVVAIVCYTNSSDPRTFHLLTAMEASESLLAVGSV